MLRTMFSAALAAAVLMCCQPAAAQDCNCGSDYAGGYNSGQRTGLFHRSALFSGFHNYDKVDNCGRGISQQEAEALWAGYCTETCGFDGDDCGGYGRCGGCGGFGLRRGGRCGRCQLSGRLRGMFAGGDCCDTGCDPCGGGLLAGGGCHLGGKLRGHFAGFGRADACCEPVADDCCGTSMMAGCGLRGKFQGLFAGHGCGHGCRLFGRHDACCEPMQSCVAGCTGAVMSDNGGSIIAEPNAANSGQTVVEQEIIVESAPPQEDN